MSKDPVSLARAGSLIDTHGGPALLYTAELGQAVPTGIGDVIDLEPGAGQFAAKSGWTSLGVTRGGINVNRGFEEVKRESDQSYGAFDSRPTSYTTTIGAELLKTDPLTLQLAWVGGAITETAKVQSKIMAAAAAGATSVTVLSGSGFTAGDLVTVGNGPNQELMKIDTVVGAAITFTTAMAHAKASGQICIKWADRSMGFGTARDLPPKRVAVIAPVGYDDAAAGGTVRGYRMYSFFRCKLQGGTRSISHSNSADWSLPIEFMAYPELDTGDPDLDTFQYFEMGY